MALANSQYAVLRVACDRLGLAEEDYRAILRQVAAVDSARDLDLPGFKKVMDRLKELGFESDWRKRTFGHRPGMATPAQIGTIRGMWHDFTGADNEAGLNTWLMRTCKVSALRFLTAEGAHQAINGLRAIARRKRGRGVA
jgi:hypothetical protein